MLTRLPSKDELKAERCSRSLSTFVQEAWPILEPATPFVYGWHIDVVCEHLEAVSAGELPRLIINIPPRMLKSLLAAVCWPAWEWLRAPHIRWLFASYAQDFAWRDSVKTRRLIKSAGGAEEGTIFQRLGYQGILSLLHDEPWQLTADQDAKSRFENTATGFRMATSRRGQATGEGGNRIVVDDPINASEARSEVEREGANLWWDETMTTRFNNATSTATIIMQRLHQRDLTGHLVEKGGWHHLCLPGTYEPSHPFVYPAKVTLPERMYLVQGPDRSIATVTVPGGRVLPGDPRTREGELLEPVRLGEERLEELRRGLGSYGFAGQIQQRPAPAEGGLFKRADFREWWLQEAGGAVFAVLNTDDGIRRYDYGLCTRFKTSDVAGSSRETADWTVIALWAITPDKHLLLEKIERQRFDELNVPGFFRRSIATDPGVVPYIERFGFGSGYIKTLISEGYTISSLRADRDKVTRALPAVALLEQHRLFFLRGAPWRDEYDEELAVFDNGEHDDQVDVTSYAARKMIELAGSGDRPQRSDGGLQKPLTAGVRGFAR